MVLCITFAQQNHDLQTAVERGARRQGSDMDRLVDIIGNNALVSALLAAAIIGSIGWLVKVYRDRRDGALIYNFLQSSRSSTGYDFRSTAAIASHTRLPEARVAHICACHRKIRRNEKQLESWTLAE